MVITAPTKIYLDKSPIHGWGVFASAPIEEGEILEECVVIDMGLRFGEASPVLIDYRFNWPQGENEYVSQVVATGFSMMYNHNSNPNAAWRSNKENGTFEFYALKNINRNEEIFVFYGGEDYWNDGRKHTDVK